MKLYESNRLEELARALASVVERPLRSPLEPEVIVVQSHGMQRWLSLELARRFGVWSNAQFPFPRAFVEKTLATVLGEPELGARVYARECLLWAVFKRLPSFLGHPAFAPVGAYLTADQHGQKRFELALRVAALFDQYPVYRPDLVLAWEHEAEQHWQALLWRSIVAEFGPHHVAARLGRFLLRWRSPEVDLEKLPVRVSVFGVSSLPPIYAELLAALSRRVEVHFFRLSPSPHDPDRGEPEHPLSASLGQAGKELGQLLVAAAGTDLESVLAYQDAGSSSLLHALQSDLRRGWQPGDAIRPRAQSDDSISVHACYSPMRELEVLRDQLTGRFERDPTLLPHDVLVMTPDLDSYAPLVGAVFERDLDEPGAIPYRVVDRTVRASSLLADLVLGLLELVDRRITASSVIDLLHTELIRRKFGLPPEAVPRLVDWIRESGVRWGENAEDRASMNLPAADQNTWHFGLSRLLLGYAIDGDSAQLFGGVLPVRGVEGSDTEWLGRLAELTSVLFAQRRALRAPRAPKEWQSSILDFCQSLLAPAEDSGWELESLQDALGALGDSAFTAGCDDLIELGLVRQWLQERLSTERASHQFLTGGVTFSALLPMRSIPSRVVCLLGMNDGQFPRVRRPTSFDLMAASPQPGDRSLRHEDRQLFLETLLSARDHLLVSYVGQSARDNTELPPSTVVAELVEHLDHAYGEAGRGLVFRHPLQAHSPRGFLPGSGALASYDRLGFEGARALLAARARRFESEPFLPSPLGPPPQASNRVELEELARFLKNPVATLLTGRLGLEVREWLEVVQDREPIELDRLEQSTIGELLLDQALHGRSPAEQEELLRATGRLPLGTPGDCRYRDLWPEVTRIVEAAFPWQEGGRLKPCPFELAYESSVIVGTLTKLWQQALLHASFTRVRGRAELPVWLEHLALQCAAPAGHSRRTVLVGRAEGDGCLPEVLVFRPLPAETARQHLADILALYQLGRRVPLPFFPESARTYALCRREHQDAQDASQRALRAAQEKFRPSELSPARAEAEEPGVALVFGDREPLSPEFRVFAAGTELEPPGFVELAERIYAPLLAALEPL